MHKKLLLAVAVLFGAAGAGLFAVAPPPGADADAQPGSPAPYNPKIAPASDEWMQAQKRIQGPDGFKVDLFAAGPMVANPVCFAVDEKNRFYVAETFRLHAGVTDIRDHTDWLDDDLACRTVDDRVAMMQRKLGDHFKDYGVQHDRIRLLEDTDGDGRADKATVFADGFHNPEDGIGAGLVTRNGDVWYTCIPDLWKLRDAKGTGKADERKRLHHGFGVHIPLQFSTISRIQVPKVNLAVAADHGEGSSVQTERAVKRRFVQSEGRPGRPPGRQVPHLDHAVFAGRGRPAARRAEARTDDRLVERHQPYQARALPQRSCDARAVVAGAVGQRIIQT